MKEYDTRKEMLADLIPQASVLAEVGVFAGDLSHWMVKALKPKKLYAVDPYSSTIGVMGSGNENGYGMEFFDLELLHGFVKHRFLDHPEVELRREFSGPFFKEIGDGTLDAVYIDGDHSIQGVTEDLTAARLAVKEGGWIFGHDYVLDPVKGNPEIKHVVKEAVDAFCAKTGLTVSAVGKDGLHSFAIQNTNKYKICLVSVSDRPVLYSKTFPLIQSYATKHGYDVRLHDQVLSKDRHPSWSKIPALKLALQEKKYDYVVWMDDDIVITNPEIPLSFFIDKYAFRTSPASVMVSSDMPNEPSTSMNCGILFLKANDMGQHILDSAWAYGDMNPILQQNLSWEQEALNFLYRYIMREKFLIIPLPNFQATARFQYNTSVTWRPGMFSIHLNNGPLPIKLQTFELLKKLGLFG